MEKNVSKKKESLNFEGNQNISFGSNTLVIYPAEGIFNNPMKKKLAEKKKSRGLDQSSRFLPQL